MRRRAYTTVNVTSGLTTSTSNVSRNGLVETVVGVRVTRRLLCDLLWGSRSEDSRWAVVCDVKTEGMLTLEVSPLAYMRIRPPP